VEGVPLSALPDGERHVVVMDTGLSATPRHSSRLLRGLPAAAENLRTVVGSVAGGTASMLHLPLSASSPSLAQGIRPPPNGGGTTLIDLAS